jgi:hypothetical protein
LAFEESQDTLVHVVGDADDVYQKAIGYYFLDIATGAVEGWYDPDGRLRFTGISDDNRLIAFVREQPEYKDGTLYNAGTVLIDRQNDRSYAVPRDFEVVTSGGALAGGAGQVLLRYVYSAGDTSPFALVTLDPRPRFVSTIELPSRFPGPQRPASFWAVFSPDGGHAAFYSGDDAWIVDLTTGEGSWGELGRRAILTGIGARVAVDMRAISDGSGFVVSKDINNGTSRPYWRSYSWDGALLAQGEGVHVQPSPDGTLVWELEPLPEPAKGLPLLVLSARRTSDGAPVFRITGVTGFRGDAANLWLADNSGIVVGNQDGVVPVLALRTGEIFPKAGLPSRTDPRLFAHDTYVADRFGVQIGSGQVDSRKTADFFPPWGMRSDEIRFVAPQLGYDYGITGYITQPQVESAPYSNPPQLFLAPHAVGMTLRDAPLGNVIGSISVAGPVNVLETQRICSQRVDESVARFALGCSTTHHDEYIALANVTWGFDASRQGTIGGTWAHVVLEDGQQGWILFAVSTSQL